MPAIAVIGPSLHQLNALLEQIATLVDSLDLVAQLVRQCMLSLIHI